MQVADESGERSALNCYFCDDSGQSFVTTIPYRPYFYVLTKHQDDLYLQNLVNHLERQFENMGVDIVELNDLDVPNHLSPTSKMRKVLKLSFDNTSQLMEARADLQKQIVVDTTVVFMENESTTQHADNPLSAVSELREYDVPYVVRVCTDLEIRAGTWYTVQLSLDSDNGVQLVDGDYEQKASPTVLAFDIECVKAPLKFPNADHDEIFMISYMISTPSGPRGFLIVSRSVVSSDIADFEYTPKPNYPGPFTIFNEANEYDLLQRFFAEYRKFAPHIVVTYNGDFFDWPYVEARAKIHGMNLYNEVGIYESNSLYRGKGTVHLDAFHWVQRDSYLPQGAQGLKAVTKYKLGYDPVEVDPEDMVKFAQTKPTHMATYSVSDAVATYYLYEKYVHLFIFSLATIIPMNPEDVLNKGSGTLCETLLMVQASRNAILCPNKQTDDLTKFYKGHLLESETYIGGKVECLETGVYRSDIEYDFDLKPTAFQQLIDNIDRDLKFAIEVEGGKDSADVSNYDTVKAEIVEKLEALRDSPKRKETPYIYHLDVGAMYPNIILSNRLQPNAIVDDATCAACDFNQAKNGCKRKLDWIWRGDYSPATRADYERTVEQLKRGNHRDGLSFSQLPKSEQATLVANRLKTYAGKAYGKTKITKEETRKDIVCMRENDFYVNTVRQFRDRRYEYKALNKQWKKKVAAAKDPAAKKQCEDRVLVYDSLQIAHKCILNSFYGYVMRKGARWRSMEMAGIVTKTGADIITQARVLVEQIGRPLELDTDGIWCILPGSFPDVYTFETSDGSKMKLEYPCVMLNADVQDKFTNHQYQTLVDQKRGVYETRSECSVFFEVDGPYRCMVLPASTEEGKLLKKRYAVFNFDGSLAELKGFELKRRGELELIKTFQSQVFERFLDGSSLKECYDSVADVANHWIDVIDTRGESLDDDELVDLISENRSMSRQLDDYGEQKGTSQTTARRLGEFLGAEIIKDKGLNCKFIIAEQPYGAPVTERAIPTAIWKAEPSVMRHFLRKWLRSPGLDDEAMDIRNVLDWDYYLDRLGKNIQKIITIPAALQRVQNPVPRVGHPDWLESKVNQLADKFKQRSITSMFAKKSKDVSSSQPMDIEDIGKGSGSSKRPMVHKMRKLKSVSATDEDKIEKEKRVELSKETFGDWLKQKKQKWRRERKQRRSQTSSSSFTSRPADKKQRKANNLEGFVREAAKSVAENEWQILEIRETSVYDQSSGQSGSGNFMVWILVGNSSIRKVYVTTPRVVYVTAKREVTNTSPEIIGFRRVDKHLPHRSDTSLLYEVNMPEYVYKSNKWVQYLKPVDSTEDQEALFETMYESGTPLMTRLLSELGSIAKVNVPDSRRTTKAYSLSELSRIDRPSGGEYLAKELTYKRLFLYVRINPRTKSGIVALFDLEGGSGNLADQASETVDLTRPSQGSAGGFKISASCTAWIVKPNKQKTVSLKQCQSLFEQLVQAIRESQGLDSEYACVSPESAIDVSKLKFVQSEKLALAGANELINSSTKSSQGSTLLLLNSSRSKTHLQRHMSTFGSFPVVSMAFPPGPAHDHTMSTLPSLNWEQPALQLSLEAYLFMVLVSFPKRVSYSRYGHVPLGNLGEDENTMVFDVSLSRLIQKNRAISWASLTAGRPDVGVKFLPASNGGSFPIFDSADTSFSQEEIWGDDGELISPVIRRSGCYRSICVDIDVQDLAIAALTSMDSTVQSIAGGTNPHSPNSVAMFDTSFSASKLSGPLGDEMSTSISLPMIRGLVSGWLKDAFTTNSLVADELLHHVYRLISNPDTILHDPALHRVVHSLMKSTFMRLLGELQRLGCSIVYASFHKITVATNKLELSGAEEYINFVIDTVRKDTGETNDSLTKVALRTRQYHSNFVFLDEFNFGTMHLDRVSREEGGDHEFSYPDSEEPNSLVVPSVVTAWNLMQYLGSELAQEYFRVIIGRFSKDVFRKQMELAAKDDVLPIAGAVGMDDQVLIYKRKMIAKHFANYLTRAVSEISTDGPDENVDALWTDHDLSQPALEFVKNIVHVLELDSDIAKEVQILKRSLLSQVDVAEYSEAAQWTDPCPKYILNDVFCSECQECRDINLCYSWNCEDCGTAYNVQDIQKRLLNNVHKNMVRYVLQDVRCSKTHKVNTRVLSALSDCSATLQLDISGSQVSKELKLLQSLAKHHQLEDLERAVTGMMSNYR